MSRRYPPIASIVACTAAALTVAPPAAAQKVDRIVVEITTRDVVFAGTDDSIYLNFGGVERKLDNPNHDDFERGNTDAFQLDFSEAPLDLVIVRQIREFSIRKPGNSFWGGGWDFGGITLRVQFAEPHADPVDPLYVNASVNVELDGGNRIWTAAVDDAGWNFPPEPPPWPPCRVIDVETGASAPDADCDGVPDDADGTFDQPPDQDGDGLPDVYEGQTGTSPTDPDADDDGWQDGGNGRHALLLRSIENVEGFRDTLNVVAEDVRFPAADSLQGSWVIPSDSRAPINLIVDQRATGGGSAVADSAFSSRILARGSTLIPSGVLNILPVSGSFDVRWPAGEPIATEVDKPAGRVRLTFQSIRLTPFLDPAPLDATADAERDGLSDELEFDITSQDQALRPAGQPAADGYPGLADPGRQELFIEIDASGDDHKLSLEAKVRVASRFHLNDIAARFDDGYLGGGQILPHEEPITLTDLKSKYKCRPDRFWPQRFGHFHYLLMVDRMVGTATDTFGGGNGRADRPGTDIVVSRATMIGEFSAIVFIHELGHNLRLCHPVGTSEPPSPSPVCDASGNPPAGWSGCNNYCGVDDDDVTAMGDDVGFDSIGAGVAGGAIIGAGIGAGIAGALSGGLGAPGGALVGGIVGGLIGGVLGFLNSDAWLREVDYHPNEWNVVKRERVINGVTFQSGLDVNFPIPPMEACAP